MKKSSVNLTEGSIARHIVVYAMPILVGQIFQNLYNSVDAIVVGRMVGKTALAAVTSCSDIAQLLVGFFSGLSAGAGVLFARLFGAKNYEKLHDAIHTALLFALFLGILMAAVGIAATSLLLRAVACPPDVWAESSAYLRVYLIGILFTSIYNVGSGVLRAVGDSRNPFYHLLIASVTNMVLDLFFVGSLHWGVMGVAIATIISQAVSVILVFRRLMRTDDVYKVSLSDLHMDAALLRQIVNLGIPTALQGGILAFSNLFVQRYVNGFGSAAMAGVGAARKIDKFVGMIAQSTAYAAMTFVSQNYGAKRLKRAFKGIYITLWMTLAAVILPSIAIWVFAPEVVSLFTQDAESIAYGASMLRVIVPFFSFQVFNNLYVSSTRGFGKSRAVMILTLAGMVGMRQIWLAIAFRLSQDIRLVFFGYPLGWFFSALFVAIYYHIVIRAPYKKTGAVLGIREE